MNVSAGCHEEFLMALYWEFSETKEWCILEEITHKWDIYWLGVNAIIIQYWGKHVLSLKGGNKIIILSSGYSLVLYSTYKLDTDQRE
jgi:hypothetical protein